MTVTKLKTKTDVVLLPPMNVIQLKLAINGITPLIQHKWSEKAKRMMREKHAGKKTKNREVRDPEQEFKDATYLTEDGRYAVPAMSIKTAIITAAHKDIGIEKTLVRKAVFIKCGSDLLLPMECSEPLFREDVVRVGMGSTDLRYRPEFQDWSVQFDIELDADLIQPADLARLVDRAGFGVGIGEMRPEKGGEYGRFRIQE